MKKNRTVTPGICDVLEEEILSGEIRPGMKLDEASLSRRFGVSRTPIREAIRQLSATGLIELVPNRGAFVSQLSISRLIEMFEVMAELEGLCGRLAARRMSFEQQRELEEIHESCRAALTGGETDEYYYANARFHDALYQGCQNEFLIDQVGQLRRRLKPYRRMQLRVPRRMKDSFEEHQAIVDAIRKGDEVAAETELRNHVLIQGERFHDFVAQLNTHPTGVH